MEINLCSRRGRTLHRLEVDRCPSRPPQTLHFHRQKGAPRVFPIDRIMLRLGCLCTNPLSACEWQWNRTLVRRFIARRFRNNDDAGSFDYLTFDADANWNAGRTRIYEQKARYACLSVGRAHPSRSERLDLEQLITEPQLRDLGTHEPGSKETRSIWEKSTETGEMLIGFRPTEPIAMDDG